MRDNSNAGQRILNSRQTLLGADDALENIIGGNNLRDGCQCFVIQEQANYRYLAASKLKADGQCIVAPHTGPGRWIREAGLTGFALLEGGKLGEDEVFRGYTYQSLVQFEMQQDELVYVGTIPRRALFLALTGMARFIGVELQQGTPRIVAGASAETPCRLTASGAAIIHPGERIVLRAQASQDAANPGFLQVLLT